MDYVYSNCKGFLGETNSHFLWLVEMKGTLRCKLHFCLYVCLFSFFCNKDLADRIVIEYLGFPSLKLSVKIRDGSIWL